MTVAEAESAYNAAKAEYTRIENILSNLTSIKGYLSQASLSFGLAKSEMDSCESALLAADIQISSFEQYEQVFTENKEKVDSTDTKINSFIGEVESAIQKADTDLETAHTAVKDAYQTWINVSCMETGSYNHG